MPFMFCDLQDQCTYASRTDYSYWLATDERMTARMAPVSGQGVIPYISRCVVCEAPTQVASLFYFSLFGAFAIDIIF